LSPGKEGVCELRPNKEGQNAQPGLLKKAKEHHELTQCLKKRESRSFTTFPKRPQSGKTSRTLPERLAQKEKTTFLWGHGGSNVRKGKTNSVWLIKGLLRVRGGEKRQGGGGSEILGQSRTEQAGQAKAIEDLKEGTMTTERTGANSSE